MLGLEVQMIVQTLRKKFQVVQAYPWNGISGPEGGIRGIPPILAKQWFLKPEFNIFKPMKKGMISRNPNRIHKNKFNQMLATIGTLEKFRPSPSFAPCIFLQNVMPLPRILLDLALYPAGEKCVLFALNLPLHEFFSI